MTDISKQHEEARRLMALRGRARRRGLVIQKSRRAVSPDNLGGLMLIDARRNSVIDGGRYDLTLDDAEARVATEIARIEDEAAAKIGRAA